MATPLQLRGRLSNDLGSLSLDELKKRLDALQDTRLERSKEELRLEIHRRRRQTDE